MCDEHPEQCLLDSLACSLESSEFLLAEGQSCQDAAQEIACMTSFAADVRAELLAQIEEIRDRLSQLDNRALRTQVEEIRALQTQVEEAYVFIAQVEEVRAELTESPPDDARSFSCRDRAKPSSFQWQRCVLLGDLSFLNDIRMLLAQTIVLLLAGLSRTLGVIPAFLLVLLAVRARYGRREDPSLHRSWVKGRIRPVGRLRTAA